MDVALSKNGARVLRVFFALVIVFLYAPIVILLIFSFNNSEVPTFPLSGFTLHWYHEFLVNARPQGGARDERIIAALDKRRCRAARRARVDRARRGVVSAARRSSPRCC